MLTTIIKNNSYQDSIVLMLLTNKINTVEGVNNVSIMMGTPANKDIFKTGGLYTPELEKASANDMAVVLDVKDESVVPNVMEEIDVFLEEQSKGMDNSDAQESVRTWDKAISLSKDAPVALISIPGTHAPLEIEKALDEGKHVFCFSDNVSIEDEKRLKLKAHEKGLLLMGPDCGTGIINGIPLAFTNVVRKGAIGIVGASGTGIQEVSTIIHKLGGGVTNAIGTGGRDLKEEIGGITLMDGIVTLENDPDTDVIVVISKPPAPAVREKVLALLRKITKPAVTIFLGEKPTYHEENLYHAYTLEETARIAVQLLNNEAVSVEEQAIELPEVAFSSDQKYIKGYYSGGTLANEAAMLIKEGLELTGSADKKEGFILKDAGYEIIDLGDDIYTQGKPHPMIDPDKRIEMIEQAADDSETAIILLDIVLGYGAHIDMATELAPAIKKAQDKAKETNKQLVFIGAIVGTDEDPQDIKKQKTILEEAGVIVADSNNQAVRMALKLVSISLDEVEKTIQTVEAPAFEEELIPSEQMMDMLRTKTFLNIGLRSFSDAIREMGGTSIQFDWRPAAGGNVTLQKALYFLKNYTNENN
ncbi:succinate--CoA ligase (ADP-forming) subunit alpha [Carnobacterium sp. 17-4]|uniref:acyl-CoA synthetase FdrA n=1 Tax=Carnobacterium sp. (strain 17-4) TaxID=208596 RepID=UPI0002058500|nr:acyl-CoA synthetase FdrA [Carnobacterium sp. 17-4]AEB30431.1 succinate--CoA ligase (ADP-forming) subunit alpha [Carnobacterium sp. 17-4]